MTISDACSSVYREAKLSELDLKEFEIYDDEDLIVFALNYLKANLDDAFEGLV